NTASRARPAPDQTSAAVARASSALFGFFGSSTNSATLIMSPIPPMPAQNEYHGVPFAIKGPTTNWPAEPPAMPNICVAPINVAARDAGKFCVAMYAAPISANTPPQPCRNRPALATVVLPDAKSSAPTPTAAAPNGTTRRGPGRSIAAPETRLNGEEPYEKS